MPHAKKPLSIAAASLLLAAATVAAASGPRSHPQGDDNTAVGLAMAADLVIARPLGLVATVAGTALFLVALPFEAMSGNITTPAHRLIADPAAYTFARPLGQLEPEDRDETPSAGFVDGD